MRRPTGPDRRSGRRRRRPAPGARSCSGTPACGSGPERPLALEGINLELRWGRAVAIVGPSGSGKTTLCEVLARLRDLDSGQALLDGIPLEDLRQSDVRRAVTLVPQDAYLFPTTIAANLRIARPDATDAELDAALARAGLAGWVADLPDGLETEVGQDGGHVVRRPTPTADTGARAAGARRAAGSRRADLAPRRRVRGGLPRRRASGRCHGPHGPVHRDPPTGRHGPLRRDHRDRRRWRAGTWHPRRAARCRWLVRVDGARDRRLVRPQARSPRRRGRVRQGPDPSRRRPIVERATVAAVRVPARHELAGQPVCRHARRLDGPLRRLCRDAAGAR